MSSEKGNSLLDILLYQPQCPSVSVAPFPQSRVRCLLVQYLLFSDLHFVGVQQQLKATNWWGGC